MQEWENSTAAMQHRRVDPEIVSHTLFTIQANFMIVSTTKWPLNSTATPTICQKQNTDKVLSHKLGIAKRN